MKSPLDFLFPRAWTGTRGRVLANVYWATGGKAAQIFGGVFVGVLVARYLGPASYGLMSYVISYVALFSVLSSFGLDHIEIRDLAKHPNDRDLILGTAFLLRLCFCLVAIALIAGTVLVFESDRFTLLMIVLYSGTLLFGSMNVVRNYFTAILENKHVVRIELTRTLFGAGLKILLLFLRCDLKWFILAFALDPVWLGLGYAYSYRRQVASFRGWRFSRLSAGRLVAASFPLLLSGTAVIVYQRINEVMLRHLIDSEAVGQFSVAARIADLAIFLPMIIAQTATPALARLHQRDLSTYLVRRQEFMDLMAWSGLAMAVLIAMMARPVVLILFGDSYEPAIGVLQILAWKAVLMALFAASGQVIIVEGLQAYAAIRNLAGCAVSVGLNFLWIPLWGEQGSAGVVLVTLLVSGYLAHAFIRPYRFLIPVQTRALLCGWRSVHAFLLHKRVSP